MSKINSLIKYVTDADFRLLKNMQHGLCNAWPDERYIRERFRLQMGYELDLEHPVTYNEKLQWLKLYDRKPVYTVMADKHAVKAYAAGIIGEEYIIPTLGVWERFKDIDFSLLPEQFVLKCTHDSHSVVICKDKTHFDKKQAKKVLTKGLKTDYYLKYREWPYKDVPRRIIAEPYLDAGPEGLTDYKVLCFDGIPKALEICSGRFSDDGLCIDFYDTAWNRLPVRSGNIPHSAFEMNKPDFLDHLLDLSCKLSQGLSHIRCDFYAVQGRLYLGEMTFYRGAGFRPLYPEEWDRIMGDWIRLPQE